jgi:hypothetical protein
MSRRDWARGPQWTAIQNEAKRGVIPARVLVAHGVPESTVYARCRPGGPWQLLLPGIVLLTSGVASQDQMASAGLLYSGPKAIVTGIEAARRLGVRRIPPADGRLHLLVPHGQQPASTRFVIVERTRRMPQAIHRGGIPLAPAARALADAARRTSDAADITEMFADAVQRGLCTVGNLVTEINEAQRRGTAVPRAVLLGVSAGARSAAEADAMAIWKRTGLPEPMWNVDVYGPGGTFLGMADGWWDDIALLWEINSYAFHLSPADYAREQEREARFVAAGVPVFPSTPTRLRKEAAAVVAELRAAYAEAAKRPRPAVRAVPRQDRTATG